MNQNVQTPRPSADRVFAGNPVDGVPERIRTVDPRDRHMQRRLALAAALPAGRRQSWAQKCLALARSQHRTAFYLMACLWLSSAGQYPAPDSMVKDVTVLALTA